jgi:hypothetical protein
MAVVVALMQLFQVIPPSCYKAAGYFETKEYGTG